MTSPRIPFKINTSLTRTSGPGYMLPNFGNHAVGPILQSTSALIIRQSQLSPYGSAVTVPLGHSRAYDKIFGPNACLAEYLCVERRMKVRSIPGCDMVTTRLNLRRIAVV
jgi:hypothetical protein